MGSPLFTRTVAAARRQWLVVVCVVALGSLAAVYSLATIHAKYVATTTVLMVAEPPEAANPNIPSTATKPLLSADLPSLASNATVLRRFSVDMGERAPSFETLSSHIRAKVTPDSTIMPVQYTDSSANAAIRGANMLGDEIVRFYRETATTRFDSLINDFASQLARRRKELLRLDAELATAAKSYPYIDVVAPGSSAGQSQSVYERLITLRGERDDLRATVAADAAAADATSALISNATPLAVRDVVNSDGAYRNVRDQYERDFGALKKLSSFGSERYPGFAELRAIVRREQKVVSVARLRAEGAGPSSNPTYVAALDAKVKANALHASDAAKLAVENSDLEHLSAQIGEGKIGTGVARLRRDRDSAESAYSLIATRLATAIVDRSEAASTGSVIVLDRAQFAPRVRFAGGEVIALSIVFMTVWLALTLAVLIDSSQERFRDSQTIETLYGSKVIGTIA